MSAVDDIIEKQLQDELDVVVRRYQSGKIRREVEAKLSQEAQKEEIRNIVTRFNSAGYKNRLYAYWLMFTRNEEYYTACGEIGGEKAVIQAKKTGFFIALCLTFFLLVIFGYFLGLFLLEAAEAHCRNLATKNACTQVPSTSLLLAYVCSVFIPFFTSFYVFHVMKDYKIRYVPVPLTLGYGIYFLFMVWEKFHDAFFLSMPAIFAILIAIVFMLLFVLVFHFIVSNHYDVSDYLPPLA